MSEAQALELIRSKLARGQRSVASRLARALEVRLPSRSPWRIDLADAWREMGEWERAIAGYRAPGLIEGEMNAGVALLERDRVPEAVPQFERALAIDPEHAPAHAYLATALLAQGRFREGWPHFAWRGRVNAARVGRTQPRWAGDPLPPGQRLLLTSDQGIGDEILHASMLPDLRARGVEPLFECGSRMVELFRRSFPGCEIVPQTDPPDAKVLGGDLAAQCGLADLGALLRPSFDDFPGTPYLAARADLAATIRSAYRALGSGPLVGLCWKAGRAPMAAQKSTRLADWAPALAGRNAVYVSLQYDDDGSERSALLQSTGIAVVQDTPIDPLGDLDLLAAQISALDLVVTVSSTTAHLAGALGVPTIVLVPRGAGFIWHWFLDRHDSPWYRSVRLLRQDRIGEWSSVWPKLRQAIDAIS